MTVKHLILLLRTYPEDAVVVKIWKDDYKNDNVESVRSVDMSKKGEIIFKYGAKSYSSVVEDRSSMCKEDVVIIS